MRLGYSTMIGAVVVALLAAAPAGAQTFEQPAILSDTTAQIAPRLEDGALQIGILDRAGEGTRYDPSRAILHLGVAARGGLPADPAFAFIGPPGSGVWRTTGSPEPRPAGILRLGVNTTGVPADALAPGSGVTFTLRAKDLDRTSDEEIFVYEDDADGRPTTRWFTSGDGFPDSRTVPAGTDLNLGTAFTHLPFGGAANNCLELEVSVTLASGQSVSDREWVTVVVDQDDPVDVRPCGAPGGVRVLDGGHVDLAPRLQPDLTLQIHSEPFIDIADAVLHVRPEMQSTLPADGSHRFLGAPGQTVWTLPEPIPPFGSLWPGVDTSGSPDSALQRQLTWRLDGVDGPGDVVLWPSTSASNGEPPVFSTRSGLPESFPLPSSAADPTHVNWSFTREGTYCLNFAVTGRSSGGSPLADSRVLTVVVGDVDPSTVTPCGRGGTPPVATRPDVPDAPAGGTPVVAATGHYELAPELNDGALRVPVHELDRDGDGPGIDHDLDDVVFYTRLAFDRLGEGRPWLGGANEPAYMLRPATEDEHPVIGWDTTRIAPDRLRGDLQWRLTDLTGPGTFAVDDATQPSPRRPTLGTVPGHEQRAWDLWPGTRTRAAVWAFSQPGVHCVELEWSGTLASGEQVSARRLLTIATDVAPQRIDPITHRPVAVPPTIDPTTVVPCGRPEVLDPDPPPPEPPGRVGPPAGPTPAPTAPRALRVTLGRPVRRAGTLRISCGLDGPGRCSVRAWLKRNRAAITLGRGAATLPKAGRRTITIKLGRRAQRELRRTRRIRLTATATASGRPRATRTITATMRGR